MAKETRIAVPSSLTTPKPAIAPKSERRMNVSAKSMKDGRKTGGEFSLVRIEIINDQTGKTRTLRVPMVLARENLNDVPFEPGERVVTDAEGLPMAFEESYEVEQERDHVLSLQTKPEGSVFGAGSYKWGAFDPLKGHEIAPGIIVGNDTGGGAANLGKEAFKVGVGA